MVDWSGGEFASCITWVQLYVNACNWMAAVRAAAPLALANQLPLLARSALYKNPTFTFAYLLLDRLLQGIALTRSPSLPPYTSRVFSAMRNARGVYAMDLCLSVQHKSDLYQNG